MKVDAPPSQTARQLNTFRARAAWRAALLGGIVLGMRGANGLGAGF